MLRKRFLRGERYSISSSAIYLRYSISSSPIYCILQTWVVNFHPPSLFSISPSCFLLRTFRISIIFISSLVVIYNIHLRSISIWMICIYAYWYINFFIIDWSFSSTVVLYCQKTSLMMNGELTYHRQQQPLFVCRWWYARGSLFPWKRQSSEKSWSEYIHVVILNKIPGLWSYLIFVTNPTNIFV